MYSVLPGSTCARHGGDRDVLFSATYVAHRHEAWWRMGDTPVNPEG